MRKNLGCTVLQQVVPVITTISVDYLLFPRHLLLQDLLIINKTHEER
jgi:hypothetical protein